MEKMADRLPFLVASFLPLQAKLIWTYVYKSLLTVSSKEKFLILMKSTLSNFFLLRLLLSHPNQFNKQNKILKGSCFWSFIWEIFPQPKITKILSSSGSFTFRPVFVHMHIPQPLLERLSLWYCQLVIFPPVVGCLTYVIQHSVLQCSVLSGRT